MGTKENTGKTIWRAMSIATLIMVISNVSSRLLGFVRVWLLALLGGTSASVDAYSFSFTIPDLINHLLAGSALPITFIPIFQKILTHENEENAWKFFSNIFMIGTLLFILFISVCMVYTEDVLRLAGKNINNPDDPGQLALAIKLTRIILPAQLFFFWGALLNGIQYARKKFFLPAMTPVCYNMGIILGGWLLFPYIGIEGFSWGVLVGAFFGNVVMQIPGALNAGMKFYSVFNLADKDLVRYVITTIPLVLGMGMSFSNEFLFRIFGSYLPSGTGSLACLDYSYKLFFFVVGPIGQAFSAGIYPFISQFVVEKRFSDIQNMLNSVLTKAGAITLPVTGILMVLSYNIIAAVLQHGEFTDASTHITSQAFSFYLLGAFFFSLFLIVSRMYYAVQNTLFPLLVSTITVICCLPVYYYLGKILGPGGIALAASVSTIVQGIIIFYSWNMQHKNTSLFTVYRNFLIILLITIAGTFLCYEVKIAGIYFIRLSSVLWKNLLISTISGGIAFIAMSAALRAFGIIDYWAFVRSMLGKKAKIKE